MYALNHLLLLTSFTLPILSLPTVPRQVAGTAASTSIPWSVTSYFTSCSPGGCSYSLSITNANSTLAYANEPIFTTSCKGYESDLSASSSDSIGTMVACDDPTVLSSQTYNGTSRVVNVNVRHAFVVKEADSMWSDSVKITGSSAWSVDGDKPVEFMVMPSQITAVG